MKLPAGMKMLALTKKCTLEPNMSLGRKNMIPKN